MSPDEAIDAAVARALQRTPPLTDATKDRIASALQPQMNQRPGARRQTEPSRCTGKPRKESSVIDTTHNPLQQEGAGA